MKRMTLFCTSLGRTTIDHQTHFWASTFLKQRIKTSKPEKSVQNISITGRSAEDLHRTWINRPNNNYFKFINLKYSMNIIYSFVIGIRWDSGISNSFSQGNLFVYKLKLNLKNLIPNTTFTEYFGGEIITPRFEAGWYILSSIIFQ